MNKTEKISIDKWTQIDTLVSIFNVSSFFVIEYVNPTYFIGDTSKFLLRYYFISVLVINWIWIGMYFLLVKAIASLILILYAMVISTIYYILVFLLILTVEGSIMTTLFQDSLPINYGNIVLSVWTLFDSGLGVYS